MAGGDEEEKKNEEEKDMELDLMAEAELLRLTRFSAYYFFLQTKRQTIK